MKLFEIPKVHLNYHKILRSARKVVHRIINQFTIANLEIGSFYTLIGFTASLTLATISYWSLTKDASLGMLIQNTQAQTWYFWPYVISTLLIILLFGVNIVIIVHRIRKFGWIQFKKLFTRQGSAGLGGFLAVAATACPVCGSTLLTTLGIAGGLAAFPFGGLEIKALSLILLVVSIWLGLREIKKLQCGDAACPVPQDYYFKKSDLTFVLLMVIIIGELSFFNLGILKMDQISVKWGRFFSPNVTSATVNYSYEPDGFTQIIANEVLPQSGFQSQIILGDAITKLVQSGVIDRDKLLKLYKKNPAPEELAGLLERANYDPILLTSQNAQTYVNLLWPIGLANHLNTNKWSRVSGKSLFNFASTGGWSLGQEKNGGSYFNRLDIVPLSQAQEVLVTKIANNTYRPCCNNSTFFQDCNHGSALLGLLELGASQGLTEDELYIEALAFNSFWFPDHYLKTALYFKFVKNTDWKDIDPKLVLGESYSSSIGSRLVNAEIANVPNIELPKRANLNCGA